MSCIFRPNLLVRSPLPAFWLKDAERLSQDGRGEKGEEEEEEDDDDLKDER